MEESSVSKRYELVVIGGSAGSLDVILKVLPNLKENLQLSIVVVLHRKSDSDSALSNLLMTRTRLRVKEAEEKEYIKPGCIYIAPADYHLLIEKDHCFSLDYSEKINYSRPSIDATFETAADAFGPSLVCLLLSGANADGVNGLRAVNSKEGITAVQDPATAEVPFMPQQALLSMPIDHVLAVEQIADFINDLPQSAEESKMPV